LIRDIRADWKDLVREHEKKRKTLDTLSNGKHLR